MKEVIKIKEFYVVFMGTIMVQAEDWNDAEKEAKKRFPSEGIILSKISGIMQKK